MTAPLTSVTLVCCLLLCLAASGSRGFEYSGYCRKMCMWGRGGNLCKCSAVHFAGKRPDPSAAFLGNVGLEPARLAAAAAAAAAAEEPTAADSDDEDPAVAMVPNDDGSEGETEAEVAERRRDRLVGRILNYLEKSGGSDLVQKHQTLKAEARENLKRLVARMLRKGYGGP